MNISIIIIIKDSGGTPECSPPSPIGVIVPKNHQAGLCRGDLKFGRDQGPHLIIKERPECSTGTFFLNAKSPVHPG